MICETALKSLKSLLFDFTKYGSNFTTLQLNICIDNLKGKVATKNYHHKFTKRKLIFHIQSCGNVLALGKQMSRSELSSWGYWQRAFGLCGRNFERPSISMFACLMSATYCISAIGILSSAYSRESPRFTTQRTQSSNSTACNKNWLFVNIHFKGERNHFPPNIHTYNRVPYQSER